MSIPLTPQSIATPTSVIHLEYDTASLPPVPSPSWTRFICVSDTHSRMCAVPEGDVLLHAGDLTNRGLLSEFEATVNWICSLPHKVKIIIAGNHDFTLHSEWYDHAHTRFHRGMPKQDLAPILDLLTGQRAREAGLVYLQDASHEFQVRPNGRTWSVYGSPVRVTLNCIQTHVNGTASGLLIFLVGHLTIVAKKDMLSLGRFRRLIFCEPCYTYIDDQILISGPLRLTHGPPSGIFDLTRGNNNVGCEDLRARLPYLRPQLHVFGHIHEARGAYAHSWGSSAEAASLPMMQSIDSDSTYEQDEVMTGTLDRASGADVEMDDRTVFVNAALTPTGQRAWRGVDRVPFGGPGFQPIIIDLLD